MAVIKVLDLLDGHLWNGRNQMPTVSLETLIGTIKSRRKRDQGVTQVDYIGEEGKLDIDPSKIKCEICREGLERLR